MPHAETLIPSEVVLDINRQDLQNNQARFIKNLDYHGKDEGGSSAITPRPENQVYDPTFVLPDGDYLKVGGGTCTDTNETYVLLQEAQQQLHMLYRIKDGVVEVVYLGPELNLVRNPEHFSDEGRFHVERICLGDRAKTYVLFLDGKDTQRFICVEDSIATHFFDETLFPYFKSKYPKEELLNLGVPTPVDCIGIKSVSTTSDGITLLGKKFWKWRIKFIDIYGRPSEHGIISDPYWLSDCHGGNINCVDISFDAGGPLIDKIQIEYNDDQTPEWHIHRTINKYKKCTKEWWLRDINDKDFTFDPLTNRITYRFCAGGECIPVPRVESDRIENPLPVTSQTLFPIAGGIGLANNKYGYGPFDCVLTDQMKFEVELPSSDDPDIFKNRNMTIWVPVINAFNKKNQAIWNYGDNVVFGGVGLPGLGGGGITLDEGVAGKFGQYFPQKSQGFIGYLAGTKYAAVSTQYKVLPDGTLIKWGAATGIVDASNSFWLQKFEFKNVIPRKDYVFRIAGQESSLNGDYQRTSTFVAGTCGSSSLHHPAWNTSNNIFELVIDCCAGDYDSFDKNEFLQIWDLTWPENDGTLQRNSRAIAGYLYEDRDNNGNGVVPIERASLGVRHVSVLRTLYRTDHNGFFFCAARDGDYDFDVYTNRNCVFQRVYTHNVNSNGGIFRTVIIANEVWNDYTKQKCNRVILRGKVVDCDTNAPVPNVVVGLTQSQFVSTDAHGQYEIIAHDDQNVPRHEKIIFMSSGNCRLVPCNGDVCFPNLPYDQPACPAICADRIFLVADFLVRLSNNIQNRGLQLGGRFAFAVNGGDWMDRENFAQTKQAWFLDIPTPNQMGTFRYPRIKWSIPSSGFPLWMKKLHFRFSQNIRFNDFISWVIDRFELLDNSGFENTIAPTKIRIHYASLNEYNKQNNFATNSTWQIIDQQDSIAKIETEDIVHFVANGDGVLFPTVITEKIRFDKDGNYFDVDYNADLKNLQEGALIKIFRPGTCRSAEIFYELCKTVNVENGVPSETSGYLNCFDSFYVGRQIPTPVVTIKKIQKLVPGATSQNQIEFETVEVSETTNVIKPYSWFFEHHSPSDLWGDHCSNRGRAIESNPLESIICKEDEIALSGAVGVNGITNYLHYFDEMRKKTFEDQGWGPITAVIPKNNKLLVICRSGSFTLDYDNNNVVFSAGGQAIVKSAERQFGIPNNFSKMWGCHPYDRNTISNCNGIVMFFDRFRVSVVSSNYADMVSVSEERYYTYLKKKVKKILLSNDTRYFHGKFNPKENQYYLTDFNLYRVDRGDNADYSYVNEETSINYDRNDTIAIDVRTGSLRKFVSFTPEGYAHLRGDLHDEQFFSFKHGIPYKHHDLSPSAFNTFYGTAVPWAISLCNGVDKTSVKTFLSWEFYCKEVLCYSPKQFTESGQTSLTPRNFLQRGERYSVSPFLCDTSTLPNPNLVKETGVNVLTDGDNLRGRWIEMLIVADPDALDKYFELTGIVLNMNGVQVKQQEGPK